MFIMWLVSFGCKPDSTTAIPHRRSEWMYIEPALAVVVHDCAHDVHHLPSVDQTYSSGAHHVAGLILPAPCNASCCSFHLCSEGSADRKLCPVRSSGRSDCGSFSVVLVTRCQRMTCVRSWARHVCFLPWRCRTSVAFNVWHWLGLGCLHRS